MRVGLLLTIVMGLGLAGCIPPPPPPGTAAGPAEAEAGPGRDRAQLWWVPVRPYLDTVVIDTLANPRREARPLTLEYVWRASVKAPRRMKDARVIVRETS